MDKTAARLNTSKTQTQNDRGEWVPAIPLPLRTITGARCACGERRWTRKSYREHYALAHILATP